jgi:hypothetical protein
MYRCYLLVVILLIAYSNSFAECECAKSKFQTNITPGTVFTFSDSKRIAVCGFKDIHISESQAEYSEFVISECGVDTITGFWGAGENVIIFLDNDTLYLKLQEKLAIGKNFDLIQETWAVEYMYYYNGILQRKKAINPELRYTPDQVKATLKQYNKTKWISQAESKDLVKNERMMQLANQLMIAALSGSSIAEQYFYQFGKKFQPIGGYEEWYSDMTEMIDFAKNQEEKGD